ncbi:TetR family transcriptional regulator (plasmid) [Gordonia polyisoprenivorans VH2]|uniref:TetR family transcriptional regulator n=1 Tax=Gordonia polyisoprenivorans (strain DSM 44266 / VH2) TaxID=1112204 RepID=H6N589_GORPV|nr:TetR family transcriptional regulator [Gordonia polyisoprenivorans]AFA76134.1 TetR family transcriptional regulator [Gordonia polyisoprenivorans VH2]
MTGRTRGRPPAGQSRDTREKILAATRELLADNGFDRTTVRAVAGRAGVDPALVHHYFGPKKNLVAEALRPPVDLSLVFADMPTDERTGPEFVRRAIAAWESPELQSHIPGVLRLIASTNPAAGPAQDVPGAIVEVALGSAVRADRRERRLALIASQMFGLLMLRFVIRQPEIVAADRDELVAQVGPVITHYLTGDLT